MFGAARHDRGLHRGALYVATSVVMYDARRRVLSGAWTNALRIFWQLRKGSLSAWPLI